MTLDVAQDLGSEELAILAAAWPHWDRVDAAPEYLLLDQPGDNAEGTADGPNWEYPPGKLTCGAEN